MRYASLLAIIFATAAPALADPVAFHRGQVLRDVNKARLGVIDSVASDGTIGLIVDGTYTRVPAQAVSLVDDKPTTSMSKRDLLKH